MSKIADRVLLIPEDVSVSYDSTLRKLIVKNSNNLLTQDIHNQVDLIIEDNSIKTKPVFETEEKNEAIVGTMNSLINNMLKGVKDGYQKVLDIKGVGYKVSLNNSILDFSLGYSHNILLKVPSGLTVDCINSTKLIIKGADKQQVGWFASKIRDFRKPNVFVKSLKGIFYQGETIKIKSGKKEAKK